MNTKDIVPGKWYYIHCSDAVARKYKKPKWGSAEATDYHKWGRAIAPTKTGWWNFDILIDQGDNDNMDTKVEEHSTKSVKHILKKGDIKLLPSYIRNYSFEGSQVDEYFVPVPIEGTQEWLDWKQRLFDEAMKEAKAQEEKEAFNRKADLIHEYTNISISKSFYYLYKSTITKSKMPELYDEIIDFIWRKVTGANLDSEYTLEV